MSVDQGLETGRRQPVRNAIRDLRGIGRDMFAAFGGGERWLTAEREAFDTALADNVLRRLDSRRLCLQDHREQSLTSGPSRSDSSR